MARFFRLAVPGATCSACAGTLQNVFKNKEGVISCSVDTSPNSRFVYLKVDEETSSNILNSWMDDSVLQAYLDETIVISQWEEIGTKGTQRPRRDLAAESSVKKTIIFHLILGVPCILLGVLLMVFPVLEIILPMMGCYAVTALSTILIFLAGASVYKRAFQELRLGLLKMHALFTVSTLVALGVSIIDLFFPWFGFSMMLAPALLILGSFHGTKAIEEASRSKASKGLLFRQIIPEQVYVVTKTEEGEELTLRRIDEIMPGEVIRVFAGEENLIPVDGLCVSEAGMVDKSIRTGVAWPCAIEKDEPIVAGMFVSLGSLDILVQKFERESTLAEYDAVIERTRASQISIKENVDKITQYFVPMVFLLTISVGVGVSFFWSPFLALQACITLLVLVCPCVLGAVIPTASAAGATKAAKIGALFPDMGTLEIGATTDVIVFDGHGTLTQGRSTVEYLSPCLKESLYLDYLYYMEKKYSDHTAQAICQKVKALKPNIEAQRFDEKTMIVTKHPTGVSALINGIDMVVGNRILMGKKGIEIPTCLEQLNLKHDICFVSWAGVIMGYMIVTDPIRPDAPDLIRNLRLRGKEVHLCTGADRNTALRIAELVGIAPENVVADCTDEGERGYKRRYIESLKIDPKTGQRRNVGYAGDAANDVGPVMTADLSFAINSPVASQITNDHAKVTIQDSLWPIAQFLTISELTMTTIHRALGLSLTYNTLVIFISCGLLVCFGIMLHPGIAAGIMATQALLITFYVLSLIFKSVPQMVNPAENSSAKLEDLAVLADSNLSDEGVLKWKPEEILTAGIMGIHFTADAAGSFLDLASGRLESSDPQSSFDLNSASVSTSTPTIKF